MSNSLNFSFLFDLCLSGHVLCMEEVLRMNDRFRSRHTLDVDVLLLDYNYGDRREEECWGRCWCTMPIFRGMTMK